MSRQQRRERLALIIKCTSLILLIFGLLGMAGVFSAGCGEAHGALLAQVSCDKVKHLLVKDGK